MSTSNNVAAGGGMGLLGWMGILFIGLKLTGFIEWSWWWVLAPFWGGFALVAGVMVIWLVVALIAAMLK